MSTRRVLSAVAAFVAAALALTACGGSPNPASPEPGKPIKVIVGASPVPHAKILEFVKEKLAADAGIDLEIKQFDDYVTPNSALEDGSLDANYFQHLPYLEAQMKEHGYKFAHGAGIHIEPFALFSEKHKSATDVPDGGTIAITNDPSNQYRGLKLLEKAGLLKDVAEDTTVLSLTDAQNPKKLKFEENQPEVIVQLLGDPRVDAALINGNFILTAGLKADNAIAVESVDGNPYANILVWKEGTTNAGVAKLDELLHSQAVKDFIKTTWPSGDVIPG